MKLKKYQKYALIIIALPIIGILISKSTMNFRYSNLRAVYLFGVFSVYICWLAGILWGIVNSIEIIFHVRENVKMKLLWSIISLSPILYLTIMMAISMFY